MRVVMLLMIMVRMDVFMLTMLAGMIVTVEAHVPTVHMIMGVLMIMGMSMDGALMLMFVLMRVPM